MEKWYATRRVEGQQELERVSEKLFDSPQDVLDWLTAQGHLAHDPDGALEDRTHEGWGSEFFASRQSAGSKRPRRKGSSR